GRTPSRSRPPRGARARRGPPRSPPARQRPSPGAWGGTGRRRAARGSGAASAPRLQPDSSWPSAPVRQRLERDNCGEQQALVLVRRELDSVGVADAEPALRDPGDRLPVSPVFVLLSPMFPFL